MSKIRKKFFSTTRCVAKKSARIILCTLLIGLVFTMGCEKLRKFRDEIDASGFQNTNTIVNPNSSWATLYYTGQPAVWTEYYFFDGDSVFNGKIYKKLFSCRDEQHTNPVFEGLMREKNLKTYMIAPYTDYEFILYDFSLETGDTIILGIYAVDVLQSDSVLINNVPKKRLIIVPQIFRNLGAYYVDTIIENIGCLRGFMFPFGYMNSGNYARELLCYTQDGELLYQKRSKCYYDDIELYYDELYGNPVIDANSVSKELDIRKVYDTTKQVSSFKSFLR